MQSLQKLIIILVLITSPLLAKADPILGQFMPYYFHDDLTYIETTQDKLLSTTNAEKVFSFDYVLNEEIFASVFATQTKGESYDKHINVYRRSQGYKLIDIEAVDVENYTFLLSKYVDESENISYVLAFSMEFLNGELDLHSHWSPNQINTIHELYNYEIIFCNRGDVLFFLPLMVNKINEITDLNMVNEGLVCPKLYVSKYEYVNSDLVFTLHNELGNKWIELTGEDLEMDIQLENDLNGEIVFPWNSEKGLEIALNNDIDAQEDLLFVKVNNITTSTVEQEEFKMEIFPNPTTDYLNIKAQGSVRLVDQMGHTIEMIPDVQGQITIDMTRLPRQQYFLINTHNSKIETKEVIVI